jgi:predicted DCC family thiol-disulfide oxidoreductase YuxK
MAPHHLMHAIEDKETQLPPSPVIFLAHLSNSDITVIYDGECRFCKASIDWLALKLDFISHPFQSADLVPFNLSREECAKEVIAILDGTTVRGAAAVAALLRARGNRVLATTIAGSGFIGRASYRWIATHRNSSLIKFSTYLLERSVNKRA